MSRIRTTTTALVATGLALGGTLLLTPGTAQAAGCPDKLPNRIVHNDNLSEQRLINIRLDPAKPATAETCFYVGDLIQETFGTSDGNASFIVELGQRPVTEPAPPADPAPVDPAPVDPAPVDPAPADPAPVEEPPADAPAEVPAEEPVTEEEPAAEEPAAVEPSEEPAPSASAVAAAESSLPVTGSSLTILIAVAVLLVAGGITAFLITHRQKVRFIS